MNYNLKLKRVKIKKELLYDSCELVLPETGIVLLQGENGCGKSTLLNQIMYNYPTASFLVAQENDLIFSDLSVADNIIICKQSNQSLVSLLQKFDIEYLLEREPAYLSGGEKRIINILRLFFTDKKIILVDEPTNDLDARVCEVVIEMLIELSKEKSLVIVTHDNRFDKVTDSVILISEKKIKSLYIDTKDGIGIETLENDNLSLNIKKYEKRNYTTLACFAFIGFLFFVLSLVFSLNNLNKITDINENQTNIATRQYAPIRQLLENGYIPINAYAQYKGRISLDYLEKYQSIVNDYILTTGTLPIVLEENVGDEVYMTIYKADNTEKRIFDLYSEAYWLALEKNIDVESKLSLFDGIKTLSESSVKGGDRIDYSVYLAIEKTIKENTTTLWPQLYCVVGPDDEAIKSLEYPLFIKNKTTVYISQSINRMSKLINMAIMLFCGTLLLITLGLVSFGINLNINRKKFIVFRNMAIPEKEVKAQGFSKIEMPKVKIILAIAASIACYGITFFIPENNILLSIAAVLCLTICIAFIMIQYIWFKVYVGRIYNYCRLYRN